jgi:hypothetical protein
MKPSSVTPVTLEAIRRQYECGPVQIAGGPDALFERHLFFDNVIDPAAAQPRDRYEALAHSVRDVLSQRWVRTEQTYERANPKRVYYMSMEFLMGRSLANNIMNLMLGPIVTDVARRTSLDWLGALEEEPDAGLGNGGLGRLAACFLDSMATLKLPAMGCGTSTGSSDSQSRTAGSTSSPTTGCDGPTRGKWRAPGTGSRSSWAARSKYARAGSRRSSDAHPR